MTLRSRLGWIPALAALLLASTAAAYDQPAVNLGFTSFLDGIPPAGPGWYAAQYVQYYAADKLPDLPFPGDPELDAWISLTQVIYQHPKALLGGAHFGLDLILPAAAFDLETDGTPLTANDGFGDLLVGPYLQWIVMGANGPVFAHRVELQTLLPTGDYDETRNLNPGANAVSLNPYWAATWFITPKWTLSGRFHYLWNAENSDPFSPPDSGIRDTQAGQALHANFATEVEVVAKHLRVGLNGYAFRQISDSQTNGADNGGEKEQVVGLGPGALWSFSPENHLFLNVYFETAAENRPEGERVNVRYVHHF
ncbi:MAG: phenol degradation protein meta [Opitutae bacterium]|nr:phenol degradation protein meta [Opitutae bacterium]